MPRRMPDDGETFFWDGLLWQSSTCSRGLACQQRACVPAGQYVAQMCVHRATSDAGPICTYNDMAVVCTQVRFDYPATAPVEGLLP